MSKKWSKEDRNSFNNSEVMREFEKLILTRAQQIGQIHEKIAQNNTQKMRELAKVTTEANQAAKELNETVGQMGLANDGEVSGISIDSRKSDIGIDINEDFVYDEDLEEESEEQEDEDAVGMDVVASSIIEELNFLAKKASDSGDYASLYEIERTIQQIRDSEDDD